MRIQLTILTFLFSLNALAVDDKSIQELFKKYDQVMDQKKVELIDEVFSQKFIKESGGKKELIEKIKGLTPPRVLVPSKVTWKKGKGELYLARLKTGTSEFVVIIEDSKPKIDGTISDAD